MNSLCKLRRPVMDKQVFAALLYGVVSFVMNFGNKAVFADTSFDAVMFILILQFIVTVASLHLFKLFEWIELKPFSWETSLELMIPSIMYCVNVGLGLTSLSATSIPVYQVLKRLVPPVTVVMSYFILGKRESLLVHLSVFVIFLGTIVTGFGDLRFDMFAYMCGVGSVISQCTYLLYIQKSGIKHDVITMLYVNSVNCIALLLLQDLVTRNISSALTHPGLRDVNVWLHLSIVLILGVVLNFSLFFCATTNSALSTAVVGVIKAVFSTALGFFTFGGQPLTLLLGIGVSLNTFGASWYIFIRYQEKQAKDYKPLPEFPNVEKGDQSVPDSATDVENVPLNTTAEPSK